jgi:hypothetical protein
MALTSSSTRFDSLSIKNCHCRSGSHSRVSRTSSCLSISQLLGNSALTSHGRAFSPGRPLMAHCFAVGPIKVGASVVHTVRLQPCCQLDASVRHPQTDSCCFVDAVVTVSEFGRTHLWLYFGWLDSYLVWTNTHPSIYLSACLPTNPPRTCSFYLSILYSLTKLFLSNNNKWIICLGPGVLNISR